MTQQLEFPFSDISRNTYHAAPTMLARGARAVVRAASPAAFSPLAAAARAASSITFTGGHLHVPHDPIVPFIEARAAVRIKGDVDASVSQPCGSFSGRRHGARHLEGDAPRAGQLRGEGVRGKAGD